MKQLMLGNEAVARGLYEAGCSFVSSYPGTPSTEITEAAAKYQEIYAEWAPNEKVAMEAALGASLAGKRSFCGMKHVGLNVAADPLFTIGYTGVNAGMIIGVADDAGMHSSQNRIPGTMPSPPRSPWWSPPTPPRVSPLPRWPMSSPSALTRRCSSKCAPGSPTPSLWWSPASG